MRVEPRALIRKLTPTATRLLEAAVGRAASSGAFEITVEHFLATLLEPDEGDVARILHNWNVDRGALRARVERDLARQRGGNPGRPVISERIFTWLEDAWLTASVAQGAMALRTGHLLLQLVARPDRYVAEPLPELESLPLADLTRDFEMVVAPSPESVDARPTVPGEGPPPPGGAPRAEALARF